MTQQNHSRRNRRASSSASLAPIALAVSALAASLVAPGARAATYDWSSGTFVSGVTAPNPLATTDILNLLTGGTKFINTAVTSNGTINASDDLFFQNGNTLTNAGTYDFKGDFGMFDGSGSGNFVTSGVLRKSGGTGTSSIGIGFVNNGGQIDVQTGTIAFGSGNTVFNSGTSFTGAGTALVNNSASFNGNLSSKNLTLQSGSYTGGGGGAVLTSGTINWTGGTLVGSWQAAAGTTLLVAAGGSKFVNGTLVNNGTITATDTLFFQNGNTLTNHSLYDIHGDFGLADGSGNGTFVNDGTFRKSTGTASSIGSVGFVNNGTIDTQAGTMTFGSGNVTFNAGTKFTGAGSTIVSNAATFNGSFTAANLILQGGSQTGVGAIINGPVVWTGGSLVGDWQLAANQTFTLKTGNSKFLNGTFTNNATIAAQDTLFFQNGNTLTNKSLYDVQGDFNLSDGSGSGAFVNNGTFRKSAGTGNAVIANGSFTNNGGTIEAQQGKILFQQGTFTFGDGTLFKGPGVVEVANSASYAGKITSQTLLLSGGIQQGGVNGTQPSATLLGTTHWTGGSLTGTWIFDSAHVLELQAGNRKNIDANVTNNGTVHAGDTLYLQNGNTFANIGTYQLQGDFGVADGSGNGTFNNSGTLVKTSGTATSLFGSTSFVNSGTIEAKTGTIEFASGSATFNAGTVFTGAGKVLVSNSATFNGSFTSGNLTMSAGNLNGGSAVLDGMVDWTGGSLIGNWQVAAGQTLNVLAGNRKNINATVVNNGSIFASDDLYFQNGNTLSNTGLYQISNDSGLADGSGNGTFNNSGRFVKSGGTGTSAVGSINFVNSGTIEAKTGTIDFSSGSATFNAGTVFTGAGKNVVSNNANFNGSFNASNLTLTGGSLNGTAAVVNGTVGWTGGSMVGTWKVASGQTLDVQAGTNKNLNGSLTNAGTIDATDSVGLQNGNSLTNTGRYDLKGDVGLYDGAGSGHFVNNGLLVKSAGTGVSDLSTIDLQNNGITDVQSGSITLHSNFVNAGTLEGSGAYTTNVLTNNGHVSPGDGVGTLTLNGNYVQTASGFLDTQLSTGASFDMFAINGTAALDGTLALSCTATCNLHTGDVFTILDAAGQLTGSFASVTTSGFLNGFNYSVVYDYSNDLVKLEVLNGGSVAAVPEPESWAMMFGGLLSLVAWTRRRSRNVAR